MNSRDLEDAEDEALEFKAKFCLVTGVQPSEYDAMTDAEVDAFVVAVNRMQERQ